MRLLHLFWPHLPLRLARARALASSESFPDGPTVLGGQPWSDGTVLDASPEARALGVRRGMPLGSAHRLAPDAAFLEPDRDADGAAVDRALTALAAFSPGVAGTTDSGDPAFGLLEAQVDGLDRLWGDDGVLVERISAALGAILPGSPQAGIAGTRFAATQAAAIARPREPVIVEPGTEAAFLAPRASALLTPDPEIRARLTRFGLRRIGQVAELPRSALIARFGEEGACVHARANGEEIAPFRPRHAPERLALRLPIEPPIDGLDAVRFVLRRLAGALADQLVARGAAAAITRLTLTLDATFAPAGAPAEILLEQRFPEPTSDAEAIERLLVARLEQAAVSAPVGGLELELDGVTPAAGQQLPLFVPQAVRDARLGWQLARLALTYGEDRIARIELADTEAPLPEHRWRWRPIGSGAV